MSRSSESYRKLQQAAEQAAELEDERWALMEVLGRLRVDARVVYDRTAGVERDRETLESTLDAEAQRDTQIKKELSELERQTAVIRMQTAAATRRLDALEVQSAALERALRDKQHQMSAAQTFLGGAVERVSRLDYKLRLSAHSSS